MLCRFGAAAGAVLALAAMGIWLAPPARSEQLRFMPAPIPDRAPPRPENKTKCPYQDPLPFLVHESFAVRDGMSPAERRKRTRVHLKAIRYRTEQYGFVEGFGKRAWNRAPPIYSSRWTEFMGLKVRLNKGVVPILSCVENQIDEECRSTPYTPRKLSGLRYKNTHYNLEVSNHLYGIAIDIDPGRNTCCGCIAPWRNHALCRRPVESIYERMELPECWVHTFERFGFYWLGRDRIQDTMHFEFLGDTDLIAP